MARNTSAQLRDFFSTEDNPVSTREYLEFYKSVNEEEYEYYKNADLS